MEQSTSLSENINIKDIQVSDIEDNNPKQKFIKERSLDEPVKQTILRELHMIGLRMKYVLMPVHMAINKYQELQNWDLWGPLLLCLLLGFTFSIQSTKDSETIFATIFVIVWLGASIITVNAKLLKANVSYFQALCILGYCLFPINISSIIIMIFKNYFCTAIKIVLSSISILWATYAAGGFMKQLVVQQSRLLIIYPVFLFYVSLNWYAIIV